MHLFTDIPSNKWSVIIFLATEESYRKHLEKIHTHTHQTIDKAKDSQDDKGQQGLDTEHPLGCMRPTEFNNLFLPLPSALIPTRQEKFYTYTQCGHIKSILFSWTCSAYLDNRFLTTSTMSTRAKNLMADGNTSHLLPGGPLNQVLYKTGG